MSAAEIIAEIHSYLEKVKDETFLRVVHSMLDTYVKEQHKDGIAGYDIDGTPRTADELTTILDKQVKAGLKGEHTTLEDLRKESDQWLARIK